MKQIRTANSTFVKQGSVETYGTDRSVGDLMLLNMVEQSLVNEQHQVWPELLAMYGMKDYPAKQRLAEVFECAKNHLENEWDHHLSRIQRSVDRGQTRAVEYLQGLRKSKGIHAKVLWEDLLKRALLSQMGF